MREKFARKSMKQRLQHNFHNWGGWVTWKRLEETAKTSKCQQRPHPSRWMVNGPSVPQSYAILVERWALFGCFFFSRRRTLLVKKHEARDPAEKDRSFFWGKLRQCASSCVSKEAEKEPCANKQDHHNDHHYYHHLNLSLPKSTCWIFKTIRHSQELSIFRCQESAPRTLFVTHLDTFTTEAQLQKSFANFGAVEQLGESRNGWKGCWGRHQHDMFSTLMIGWLKKGSSYG